MATRRVFSSRPATFWLSAGEMLARCSTSGMTMWFDTMIASATHSTITIAVAADRPPMNTATVNSGEPPASGSASTNMSLSIDPIGKTISPASAIGMTNRLMAIR